MLRNFGDSVAWRRQRAAYGMAWHVAACAALTPLRDAAPRGCTRGLAVVTLRLTDNLNVALCWRGLADGSISVHRRFIHTAQLLRTNNDRL